MGAFLCSCSGLVLANLFCSLTYSAHGSGLALWPLTAFCWSDRAAVLVCGRATLVNSPVVHCFTARSAALHLTQRAGAAQYILDSLMGRSCFTAI
jgi:hypothetical protein